jgi:hypothetical protein
LTDTWTLDEAAVLLDPPVTAEQLRLFIQAAQIRPAGQRRTGRRGRPTDTYDVPTLMRVHAVLVTFIAATQQEMST